MNLFVIYYLLLRVMM